MRVEDYIGSEKKKEKKYLIGLIRRTLLTACIVLTVLIICNSSPKFKKSFNNKVFKTNYNFSKINSIYQKYLLKIKKSEDKVTSLVSKDKLLDYTNKKEIYNGVNLEVGASYPVKALDSGLVVFIGEREETGKSIIIEQSNGIDVIYGNVKTGDIKIYDYVEKGNIIGTTIYNDLYLEFQRDGESLDYEPYIES